MKIFHLKLISKNFDEIFTIYDRKKFHNVKKKIVFNT